MEKDCPLKKRTNEFKAARNQKRFGKNKEVPWWQMVIVPNNPSFSGRI
jgi:hypothetical protein